ncbi:uncharacterized protein MELLADRAFT_71896, partial [Melampsora larici-populina 98AG31]
MPLIRTEQWQNAFSIYWRTTNIMEGATHTQCWHLGRNSRSIFRSRTLSSIDIFQPLLYKQWRSTDAIIGGAIPSEGLRLPKTFLSKTKSLTSSHLSLHKPLIWVTRLNLRIDKVNNNNKNNKTSSDNNNNQVEVLTTKTRNSRRVDIPNHLNNAKIEMTKIEAKADQR